VTTRIFSGEQAMLSVVSLAPNAQGILHHHPEEQWGVLLRVQDGEEIPVKKGDFWRTPGNVPHTMRAGPEGARVLDVFSPPRPEYGLGLCKLVASPDSVRPFVWPIAV
jgi:quercetin dioxygenase-like cupin family protein